MKIRKKTLALLLFSVAFMCSVGVSAFVLWQTDALRLQTEPVMSPSVQAGVLYPARDEGGLWGYIDGQGEWQIAAQFEQARIFDGKAAWVQQNGLWGAVDATGAFIVQPEYARIEQYIDGNNSFVAAFDSALSSQSVNSALYDINGQKLFGLAGELLPPSSGLMAFSREKGGTVRWGYINPHGEIIIEPEYAKVGQAAGNFALVKDENGQTILLNIYAKTGIEFGAAADLNAVGSRLVLVCDDVSGLYGFMDVDGNLQIDYSLAAAEAFRGGAAFAAEKVGDTVRYGLLTPEGVWAVEPTYRSGVYLDNGIYAMAQADEAGYHIVNALGEKIVDGVVYRYEDWTSGLLACHTADKTVFVNTQGEQEDDLTLALTPNAIWQGHLWGVVDENGASWYDTDGVAVFAEGHERQLTDEVRMLTALENRSGGYLVYYPQVEGEKLSGQWSKLNVALKNVAVDDYIDDYSDGEDINFTVSGNYTPVEQGNVLTVCQHLTLDDAWQTDGGSVENVLHTVCFDKTDGRQYRLGDLFVDNFNWRTELSEPLTVSYELQCAGRGEASLVEVIELLEKRLARNVDFACGADGVTLYFGLSDGYTAEILLLYADVEEWLDKDGALWQALQISAGQATE